MSWEASAWAVEQEGLSAISKLLLLVLGNSADHAGVCYPGHELLAKRCCCARRTVVRQMQALELAGLVGRAERRRRNGSRTSDWIVLAPHGNRQPLLDAEPSDYPTEVAEMARSGDSKSRDSGGRSGDTAMSRPERTEERTASSPNGEESSSFSVQAKEIFEHWKGAMGLNGNAKLTADRRQKVVARLKEGLPVEEIKRAIDGVAASSYHRSHNYDDLELICRTGSNVQRYARFPLAGEELTDHQKEVERALERVPEPDADKVERNLASVGI